MYDYILGTVAELNPAFAVLDNQGIGYLIVYGGQVFKLDLVMASTVVLCVLATLMYVLIATLEKVIIKYKNE